MEKDFKDFISEALKHTNDNMMIFDPFLEKGVKIEDVSDEWREILLKKYGHWTNGR